MAVIYRAQVRPTKLELLARWLPTRPWYTAPGSPRLTAIGAYRFDDPLGEVGIETHVVRADDDAILQVPLTYRGAPLPGGERLLVGTMEHSVLGRRWVYDACGDPVYVTALADVILGSGSQAEEYIEVDGRREQRALTVLVRRTGLAAGQADAPRGIEEVDFSTDGTRTVIKTSTLEVTLLRVLDLAHHQADEHTLVGVWPNQHVPVTLATAQRR